MAQEKKKKKKTQKTIDASKPSGDMKFKKLTGRERGEVEAIQARSDLNKRGLLSAKQAKDEKRREEIMAGTPLKGEEPKIGTTLTPSLEERKIERNIFGLATPEERERLLEERKARGSEFDIFKEQLPCNRGEGFGGTMKEVGKDILEAGAAASIPISAGKKIYGAGKAAKEAAAGAEVISPELKGILDFLGSGKKETAKVIEELNKAKVINRLKGITGITPKAAEGIYKAALPNKPRMLMSMAKNLSPAKKVIAGLTLFGTTYYAQSQIFWASADNVATAGSMGANALLSLVTFQDPSPEVVEARKETIMRAMEESGTAMWWASFINPVTAYPLYLFYKKTVLDTANEFVQDRFEDIDMIMANKAAGG